MPRLAAQRHSLRFSPTAYAQPDGTGKAGFAIILLCACPYAGNERLMQQPLFSPCGVLFRAWRPTHFLIEPMWLIRTHPSYCKRCFSLEVV